MLGQPPDAAETDPRTPELRPRRPDPARADRRPRSRPGPGRADRRRRRTASSASSAPAAAILGADGDDLRRPVPGRGDGGRRPPRRRADRRPSGSARWRRRSAERRSRAAPAARLRPAAGLPAGARAAARRAPGRRARAGRRRSEAGTLEGSAYLGDVATLFAGYAADPRRPRPDRHPRDRPRGDRPARRRGRRLVAAAGLPLRPRRPDPQPARPGPRPRRDRRGDRRAALREGQRGARGARAPLLESLERDRDRRRPRRPRPNPENTRLRRSSSTSSAASGRPSRSGCPLDDSLVLLRSAGERGEAEAIAARGRAAARRRDRPGGDRDRRARPGAARPAARLGARVLRGPGRARGGGLGPAPPRSAASLVALLEALCSGPAGRPTCCATCGARRASPPGRVDWFERRLRRDRVQTAAAALDALGGAVRRAARRTCPRLREAAAPAAGPGGRGRSAGGGDGGPCPAPSWRRRAGGAIATAMAERAELEGLAPLPDSTRAGALGDLAVRVWQRPGRGPGEDRRPLPGCGRRASTTSSSPPCRTASSRAAARRRRPLPLRGPARVAWACSRVATPRPRSATCSTPAWRCRGGGSSSPTATATRTASPRPPRRSSTTSDACSSRRLAARARPGRGPDPRPRPARGRPPGRRRAFGDRAGTGDRRAGPGADARPLLAVAGVEGEIADAGRRRDSTRPRARRGRDPGAGAALEPGGDRGARRSRRLRRHHAGGLRRLLLPLVRLPRARPRSCSTRFPTRSSRAASCTRLLDALYRERPGGDPLPRPGSLDAWIGRGRELVAEIAADREPRRAPGRAGDAARASKACWRASSPRRRAATPAASSPGCSRPAFSECRGRPSGRRSKSTAGACTARSTGSTGRPTAAPSSSTTSSRAWSPRGEKLEEEAKLQLQLYLIAVAELWGAETVGGLYHPLRGTSARRPRGAGAGGRRRADLAAYGISRTDAVDARRVRGAARRRPAPGRRDRRPDARRADRPRPRPAARACATTGSARRSATSPRSAAATGRRSRPAERRRGGER